MDLCAVISTHLNPVLVPAGFAAGQGGFDGAVGTGQVIFCAAQDDLSRRFPLLPHVWEPEPGAGRCVDLVVTVDAASIRGVALEGQPLAETLRATGQQDLADTVVDLHTLSGNEAASRLTRALAVLFPTASPE